MISVGLYKHFVKKYRRYVESANKFLAFRGYGLYNLYIRVKGRTYYGQPLSFLQIRKELLKRRKKIMTKYECEPCGYVYDPAEGDPDNGIAPGTAFEDLPDDWVCPICGADKSEFKPVE